MGQITSLFAHKVIAQADATLDRQALLAIVGIDAAAPIDPGRMVEDVDYYAFLEAIARSDPRAIDLPLRVGATMRSDEYGAFGLAWKSAPDLLGSLVRAERYARVLTSVTSYEVRHVDEGVWMLLHRSGERRLGLRLSNEASIASVLAISQEVSATPVRPLAVCFHHPAPLHTQAHEAHFGCPVRFGAECEGLLFSRETARQANRLGDAAISQFFDAHLEQELAQFDDDATLERRIRIQVSQSLSQGIPRMSDIASRLGMSARTLQRRLAEREHSYQSLVDDVRRELAERLLRGSNYPLAEVAFLTGFSEQSAFNRAFKRWAGQTPRSFRLSVRQ